MSEKFTKGPWKVLGEDVVLECNEKEVVAWVGDIDGQMINNANLIAAAPEMYEALKNVCHNGCRESTADEFCLHCSVAKALRKARGEEESK